MSGRVQLALAVAVFALTTLLALAAGATNLGTALGFGQVTFTLALVYVILRR